MEQIQELMFAFLNDKKSSLKSVLVDITTIENQIRGVDHFLKNIDDCDLEEVDIRKKFKTMMKVSNKQNRVILKLTYLILVYMQGDKFDTDVAHMLMKFGKGEEALQAMFKNKFKGV